MLSHQCPWVWICTRSWLWDSQRCHGVGQYDAFCTNNTLQMILANFHVVNWIYAYQLGSFQLIVCVEFHGLKAHLAPWIERELLCTNRLIDYSLWGQYVMWCDAMFNHTVSLIWFIDAFGVVVITSLWITGRWKHVIRNYSK